MKVLSTLVRLTEDHTSKFRLDQSRLQANADFKDYAAKSLEV